MNEELMKLKILTVICLCAVFSLCFQTSFGRQKGDWNSLSNFLNQEIAVQTRDGKTSFGFLRVVSDNEIKVQIAGKKNLAATETAFDRQTVRKVWRANLRFGGRNIGKGALIGAGAGAGIGAIGAATAKDNDDGLAFAAVPIFALYGAGIGAVAGIFVRKSHKKGALVYSV